MAGDRIKGITIEFRGDTTKLSAALSTLKKEGKATYNELKEIDRALKFNPGNITLLTQKQQLLKQRVVDTTDKVRLLKAKQKEMAASGDVDKKSAEYRELQREIIKAESQQKHFAREMVKFGSARFNQVGTGLQNVGRKLTNITRYARMAAGAIAGIALYKGFERLKTLDDVSTSLQKLGYQGKKLEQVMTDTKGAVGGTRFALTDMSKVAKGALGAGVEDQYKLGEYLGRVGDLAQVAGIDVTKMGSMMNKALSKGTVDAKLLNQMNANGIPIYTDLAKSMGVSTEELLKMTRSGEVGFNDLYKATAKYNGLAQEMGTNTFSGAVTVLGQQFGLMGASFLEGAYEPIKSGVKGVVKWLKQLQENGTIKAWGEAVGQTIQYFVKYFKDGETATDGLSGKVKTLVSVLGPIVKTIGAIVKAFMSLPAPIKGAVVAFALFGGPLLTVIGGFTKLLGMVSGFGSLAKAVGGVGKAFTLLTGINPILLAIVAGVAAVITVGTLLYKNWDTVSAGLLKVWTGIKTAAITVWNGIKTALSAIWNGIKTAAGAIFNGIKAVITAPIKAARTAIKTVANGIKTALSFSGLKEKVGSIFKSIKDKITTPIERAKEIIKGIIDKIKGFFHFSVSLPHIKLPHFSISPKGWKLGDLLKGSIPSLGIDWYANGGIFNSPSVIGVGEAGAEAVLPIEKLNTMLQGMADSIVSGVVMANRLQSAGSGGDITIPIYLYPSGPKMGEEIVKAYDYTKKQLG